MPIFHKQTEVGDGLTAELRGQRTEGIPTLSLHASEIEDNNLRQCACYVKDEQLSLHAFMKLKSAISHYALVSSRANNSDAPRLKLRTNSCQSRLRRNTAGKWHTTRQHQQKGRIQVDTLNVDWSAQQLCMTFT